jgi:hypothetical protein
MTNSTAFSSSLFSSKSLFTHLSELDFS